MVLLNRKQSICIVTVKLVLDFFLAKAMYLFTCVRTMGLFSIYKCAGEGRDKGALKI